MYTNWLQPADVVATAVLERLRQPAQQLAWSTGLRDLDALTGGLHGGSLWAVTGGSGAGKSLLAVGLAREVAVAQQQRVILVSTRETTEELAKRLLSAEAKVGLHHIRHGPRPSDDEWTRLEAALARLDGAELYLGQAASPVEAVLSLEPLRRGLEPPRLVVVDDLAAGAQRLDQLRHLQALAGRLQCAVVAVLAPDLEKSGVAEEEAALVADVVMRLENCSGDRAGEADLVVTHNRRGPISRIVLGNQMHYARFVNPSR